MFFSLEDPNKAYANVQHPSSGNDALVEVSVSAVPVPAAAWLLGSAFLGLVGFARARRS